MIVVADAGPVNYLVLIGAINHLSTLYGRVAIPEAVARELKSSGAPEGVRRWIADPPLWCEVMPDPPLDEKLQFLDQGERTAIGLAISLQADRLLIDETDGRAEAMRRKLRVTGTIGVLIEAHRSGLTDFEAAVAKLSQTNFFLTPKLLEQARHLLSE
jgi:predicted nucleic acid-binding protein